MEHILNEILSTLKEHSKRFDSIDERFASIDERFDAVEKEITSVKVRLDQVEENLSEKINNNATEFRSHFKHIENKLDQHEETFLVISDELKGTRIDIIHLSEKSGVHDTEINQIKKRIHS